MFEANKGLQNKDKDPSEQRINMFATVGSVTGASTLSGAIGQSCVVTLGVIGCSQTLIAVSQYAFGVSGSPIVGLQVQRFVVGSGNTTIALNGSSLLTVVSTGLSGVQAHSVPPANSSLLIQGDLLQVVTSAANSAAVYRFEAVLQVLQAVRTDYGV